MARLGCGDLYQFLFWCFFVGLAPGVALDPGPSGTPAEVLHRWVTDKQALDLWFAGVCLLSALSTFLLSRYRIGHPGRVSGAADGEIVFVPRIDELWYINLRVWPWIFLV